MNLSSPVALRAAVSVAAFLIVSACTDDGRPTPLSGVELVAQAPEGRDEPNVNIDNPTLQMPATFGASPGEMLTLVWSDEFDGDLLDPASWFFATGDGTEKGLPGGWGNNELQYYLPDSAQLGNGVLRITARQETIGGLNYTSARINTEDRFAFKYGRIEASIKLPAGQGLWPAFWMLPQDTTYGVWAASGEIDIVETVNLDGSGSDEIFGTLHFGGEFPANSSAGTTYTPSADITSDFHTYALEWDETEIRWYFDDTLYAVQNSWSSTAAPFPAPFPDGASYSAGTTQSGRGTRRTCSAPSPCARSTPTAMRKARAARKIIRATMDILPVVATPLCGPCPQGESIRETGVFFNRRWTQMFLNLR